jgi:hypothetical protein
MWACSVSIQSGDTKSNLKLTARRPANRENLLELNRLVRVIDVDSYTVYWVTSCVNLEGHLGLLKRDLAEVSFVLLVS